MVESSSGFGDESPILFKYPKKCYEVHYLNSNLNLEDLYKDLLLHLKKSRNITRDELKSYLEQVTQMNPQNHRNRWLLQKVRGLLKYILKKRNAFQNYVAKGEIIIYEKSCMGEHTSFVNICESPRNDGLYNSSSFDIPLSLLSNNNFTSMEPTYDENLKKMETDNYSQDLFDETAENLHNFAQENYQLFKHLTENTTEISKDRNICSNNYFSENDDNLFKVPFAVHDKIDGVYKLHEALEENYNSLFSLTPSISPIIPPAPSKLKNINSVNDLATPEDEMKRGVYVNVFDILETEQTLTKEYIKEFYDAEKWVHEVIYNLIHLKTPETKIASNVTSESKNNTLVLNEESTEDKRSVALKTIHSKENLKIIEETCSKYKKNLETKKSAEVL